MDEEKEQLGTIDVPLRLILPIPAIDGSHGQNGFLRHSNLDCRGKERTVKNGRPSNGHSEEAKLLN